MSVSSKSQWWYLLPLPRGRRAVVQWTLSQPSTHSSAMCEHLYKRKCAGSREYLQLYSSPGSAEVQDSDFATELPIVLVSKNLGLQPQESRSSLTEREVTISISQFLELSTGSYLHVTPPGTARNLPHSTPHTYLHGGRCSYKWLHTSQGETTEKTVSWTAWLCLWGWFFTKAVWGLQCFSGAYQSSHWEHCFAVEKFRMKEWQAACM